MKTRTASKPASRAPAPPPAPPILAQAEATISAAVQETKTYIRRQPNEAVLWALLAGYVLRMLPLGAILNVLVRTILITLRPAILIFGASKVWAVVRESSLVEQRRR